MTKSVSVLGSALLAATLAGCATDKPLMQQASENFDAARARVSSAIAPSTPASGVQTANSNNSATEAKKTGITFSKDYDGKAKGNPVTTAGRTAVANFTSLNKEYVAITVTDPTRGTKIAPVTNTAQIALESCSPTVGGTVSSVGGALVDRATALLGRAGANALPGGGGALGNVARTTTTRQATASATDAKANILNGANNLTAEQQKACKADMEIVSAEIKKAGSQFAEEYAKANKGVKPVVTYTGSADLKDLQLGLPTRAVR